jgi:hypothetical protein
MAGDGGCCEGYRLRAVVGDGKIGVEIEPIRRLRGESMTAFRRLLGLALLISVFAVHAQSPATTSAPASIAPLIPQLEDYLG